MKVGVIGLGDIARKAYMPVLGSKSGYEWHLYTRNQQTLEALGAQYRISNLHSSLDSLLQSGIKGALVHTATDAHFDIVETLLQHGIHVYVDKPITMYYKQSERLVELAEEKGLLLQVGFNRRFAPVYRQLKEVAAPSMILMQKNRKSLPDELRRFVVEDFIHVVDTLRFLFPYPVADLQVNGLKKDGLLYQAVFQLIAATGEIAIGIMNRDSGTTEEKVEVMSAGEKRVAYNVSDLVIQQDRDSTHVGSSDWEPTLHKRGFEQVITDFLEALSGDKAPFISARDALKTHELCERIVEKLQALPDKS
ncbi:Gfo/Idh/MocA family protein [Pontibacter chitinilyticus]|uniref:Gfo/Idh/MocA family protein n=1 Tax=Pontibacter chitinilyticus TaxID=2674989 RepID=UPI00321BE3A1